MNSFNRKLLKAPSNFNVSIAQKGEPVPKNIFDPQTRKQNELKAAIMLINCLNSFIMRPPLFPDKISRRTTR